MICTIYSVDVVRKKGDLPVLVRYFSNLSDLLPFFRKYCERNLRKKVPAFRVICFRIDFYSDCVKIFNFLEQITCNG